VHITFSTAQIFYVVALFTFNLELYAIVYLIRLPKKIGKMQPLARGLLSRCRMTGTSMLHVIV